MCRCTFTGQSLTYMAWDLATSVSIWGSESVFKTLHIQKHYDSRCLKMCDFSVSFAVTKSVLFNLISFIQLVWISTIQWAKYSTLSERSNHSWKIHIHCKRMEACVRHGYDSSTAGSKISTSFLVVLVFLYPPFSCMARFVLICLVVKLIH